MIMKSKALSAVLLSFSVIATGCGTIDGSSVSTVQSEVSVSTAEEGATESSLQSSSGSPSSQTLDTMKMTVDGKSFDIVLEGNDTVSALKDLLPLSLEMSELNGNEKYYYLDTQLPTDPYKPGEISAGDVMLYGNNCLVVFYESFSSSYSYTKIGHISDAGDIEDVLGSGDVKIDFTVDNAAPETDSTMLVAYFSRTGNTEKIAEHIVDITGADSYVINAAVPYTDEDIRYQDDSCRANKEQNDKTVRPEIGSPVLPIDNYDVIFLGYPIWWGEEPRIIDTFLESYDFSGKTVIPFCTSGSSGIASSEKNISKLVTIGKQLPGRRFSASASRSDVSEWIDSLELPVRTSYTGEDVENMSSFLLARKGNADLSGKDYDLNDNDRWDVFDLCLLRRAALS